MSETDGGRRGKLIGLAWLIGAIALASSAALGFSALVRLIPFSFEEKAAEALPVFSSGVACNGGQAALEKLVARLYPLEPGDRKWKLRVQIVRSPEVNAFASLGGKIFVNDALVTEAESPEELAGVLAHEIEHVKRRHVLEGVLVKLGTVGAIQLLFSDASATDVVQTILGLQYGKAQEREADEGALERLVRAEIDTAGFRNFFERMQKSGGKAGGKAGEKIAGRIGTSLDFLSDHPSDSSRAERARAFEGRPHRPVLDDAEWSALRLACH